MNDLDKLSLKLMCLMTSPSSYARAWNFSITLLISLANFFIFVEMQWDFCGAYRLKRLFLGGLWA